MANDSFVSSQVPWRRVHWVLGVTVLIVVAAFAISRGGVSPSMQVLLDNVHWTVSALTGAWLAWVGYRSAAPLDREARGWFAWALGAYAGGQVLFDGQAAMGWHPVLGPSDLFYSCLGPGCAMGLWCSVRARATPSQLRAVALDAGALSIAVLALTLALYLPKRGGTDALALVVLLAYPVTLLSALCLGVVSILSLSPRGEKSWWIFLVALVADGVLWMEWNSLTLDDGLEKGTWFNFIFSIAALALGWGAMGWRLEDSVNPAWKAWCARVLRLLPLLLVIMAATSLVLALTIPAVPSVARYAVVFGVVVVLAIGVFRQSVQVRELDRVLAAERLAKETEQRFRMLFETAQDAIFLMTPGEFIECNPSTLRMFGCARNQIVGHSPVEFSPEIQPDGRRSDHKAPEKIMAAMNGVPQVFDWTHRKLDGTLFDAEVSLNRIELGGRFLLQAIVRDRSEHKQVERELLWRTALFEAQVDSAIDGILVVDNAGKKVIQNKRLAAIWGISQQVADDLDDAESVRIVSARTKNPADFAAKIAYLYSHPDEISREEIELIDGKVLDRYSAPVRDREGKTYGRIWTFRDISDRKQAEEALATERNLLRTLFNVLPDYIYVKDLQGRFITCNERCARVMGAASPEEVIGRTDADFFSPEMAAVYRTDDEAAVRGVATIEKEECLTRADGSRLYTLTTKLPLRDRRGQIIGMVGNGHDITGRKNLEEQLRQAQKMEAIGQLSGGVAHDFNNLLTVILGNLGLIRSSGHEVSETPELLDQINHAALRAANLTRQLLAFSRRQVMQSQSLDLNGVVAEVSRMLRRVIGETVEMKLDLAEPSLPIQADPGMLEQVLLNLCINARDAMPGGGQLILRTAVVEIEATAAAHRAQARAGSFARLTVTDTGIGMSPEDLAHAFEPFFTTKEVGKGTGLGLASVYGIVQQHRGWVVAESTLGRGTTFEVYLPLAGVSAVKLPPPPPPATIPGGGEIILLVEDDLAVQGVARAALARLGYVVLLANDGNDAQQVWRKHKNEIQLLLTDMVMPGGLTGRDVAALFRKDVPALKVIFMSGYNATIAGTDFPRAMGDLFLGKPFEIQELAGIVRKCLDGANESGPSGRTRA